MVHHTTSSMYLLNPDITDLRYVGKKRISRKKFDFIYCLQMACLLLVVFNLMCISYNLNYNIQLLQNVYQECSIQKHEWKSISADVAYDTT